VHYWRYDWKNKSDYDQTLQKCNVGIAISLLAVSFAVVTLTRLKELKRYGVACPDRYAAVELMDDTTVQGKSRP
jgi:hypothetical protein